jgi:hypothetical protein
MRAMRVGIVARLLARAALTATLLAAADDARADAPASPGLNVEALPMFGAGGSVIATGWSGVVVRIQNGGASPVRGEVTVNSEEWGSNGHGFTATVPFNVGASTSIHVRAPVDVTLYGELNVKVTSDTGEELSSTRFTTSQTSGVVLLDVSETWRLRGAINDVAVAPTYRPAATAGRGGASPTLTVASPRFNPATGDPLLPDRAALYGGIDAVLVRSDILAHVRGAELEALAGYVLAGGTLAIVVSRPEDIRNEAIESLVGGPISRAAVSSAALAELTLASGGSTSSTAKAIPPARHPSSEVSEALIGYGGANLHGSSYGNSAFYGLGEVHLLAFDPTCKPALDDPWVQARVVDLARRGYDRRSTQIFRPGEARYGSPNAVRQQLDPNQGSRWAIGVAALLLCVYAVLAGPINFGTAASRGKPLRALLRLPIFAAVTFALVVAVGVFAKGVSGRARHLTLVEAGAGMPRGAARRFRGFFAAHERELTVRTSDGSSVVATANLSEPVERKDHLLVDRDGARLVEVAALPWQTVVVQEDGFASLGEGIAVVADGDGGLAVINRSGRDLRAVILRLADGTMFYAPRLRDGERLTPGGAAAMTSTPAGSAWQARVNTSYAPPTGGIVTHRLFASELSLVIDQDAPGLSEAWTAIESASSEVVDWFPDGAPVVLAQIDGGEGRGSDSGMRLESDRVLVRVVGRGGKP